MQSQLTEIASRHQAHIERVKSHEVKSFTAYLNAMIKNTQFELLNNDELTEENKKGLAKRINAIKQILKNGFTDFKSEFDKIILDFAEYESQFEKKALETTVKYDFALPSSQQIQTAVYTNPFSISGADGGSVIDSFYKRWTDNEVYRIGNIIQLGYATGKTNQQMAKELNQTGYGVIDRNMQTLIRTTMQHAANQSRQAVWNKNKDIVKQVEWVSTLDKRTCIAKDEKVNMADGTLKPIQDVEKGDYIITHKGNKREVLMSEKTGNKKVVRVTFSDGRAITATPDHKIWDGIKWVQLSEMIHDNAFGQLSISKVESIGNVDVYDLHIDEDHSYYVNGIPVHNSTLCQSLDGNKYDLDEGPRPPAHPGCRSTTVAVLDKRFKLLEQGMERSARDPETGEISYVPKNQTYYDWLKSQPAGVQDSIIGNNRGKLLRNGGLTSKRFAELQLDKNFKPMTLDEMRALEPIAFERANI